MAVALAISLAISAILALRIKDESDQQARLRTQVAQLRDEIETLHRQQSQEGKTIFERIAAAVEEMRQLKFVKTVKPRLLSDEQLAEEVEKSFREDNSRSDFDESDAILTALGLLGKRDDLYDIMIGVVREQVGGFYDPVKKTLVVGGKGTNPSPLEQVLLSHEYVHALTDQHYDLTHLDKLNHAKKADQASAYLALIEGDATMMMFQYAQKYLTPSERSAVQSEAAAAPSQRLEAAPPSIREALLFPYEEGERFARALVEAGGIAALNKAYLDPPTSTEQILHISKFLGSPRDEPTTVTAPKLAPTMGSGWKDLSGGEVGELDVRMLVDQFMPQADAEKAAAGWDGGRFVAAESSQGAVVAELTEWDSELQAREAAEILGRWLPRRYGGQGSDFRPEGATGRGWDSPDGAGAVTRVGTRVLFVVGPDRASVDRARGAFSGF